MKNRRLVRFVIAAALGLAFSALAAQAQLNVNVTQQATFGPFVGGINNSVSNNGSVNTTEIVSTGVLARPFTITYTPMTGPSTLTLGSSASSTLITATLLFTSPTNPANYFSSVGLSINTDFDSNGGYDLNQNYTLNLSPFVAPNGLTGVSYAIIPEQYFGQVTINGQEYAYSSVIANAAGTLFDGSNTTAAVQFQFLATPVPEPSTYAFAALAGIGGIVAYRRHRIAKNTPQRV